MTSIRSASLLPLVLGCAACASAGSYPSLLPRPAERQVAPDAGPGVAAVQPDPALDARLAEQRETLAQFRARFDSALARNTGALRGARNASEGSEAWLSGQAALTELNAIRSGTSGVLASLTEAAIDRGRNGKPGYDALDALIVSAETEVARQTARIEAATGG